MTGKTPILTPGSRPGIVPVSYPADYATVTALIAAKQSAGYPHTGKTLLVDGTNGNDATAQRGTSFSFSTLPAAAAAASSGDLIRPAPGNYSVSASLYKAGVKIELPAGVRILYSSAALALTDGPLYPDTIDPRSFGAALDGTTDDTTALQVALNLTNSAPKKIDVAGNTLASGNDVYSNVWIDVRPGAVWKLKANSNRPILRNKNKTAGAIVDQNIVISGTYDGNWLAQLDQFDSTATAPGPTGTRTAMYLYGIAFQGVRNLLIKDFQIQYARTYGVNVGNFENVTIENARCVIDQSYTAEAYWHRDGFHFNGPGRNLVLRNLSGSSWDDFISLAPDELAPFLPLDWFSSGPITDVTVDGVHFENCLKGVAMYSSRDTAPFSLDRIDVRNLSGTVLTHAVQVAGYGGSGLFGAISIDGVQVDPQPGAPGYSWNAALSSLMLFNANVICLNIRNVQRMNWTNNRQIIIFDGNFKSAATCVSGLQIYDDVVLAAQITSNAGSLGSLRIENAMAWVQSSPGGALVSITGGEVFNLALDGIQAIGLQSILTVGDGVGNGHVSNLDFGSVYHKEGTGTAIRINGSGSNVAALSVGTYRGDTELLAKLNGGTLDGMLPTIIRSAPGQDAEALRLPRVQAANDIGAYLTLRGGAAGSAIRGYFGFGHTGSGTPTIFAVEPADSVGLRAEGHLLLGSGGDHVRIKIGADGTIYLLGIQTSASGLSSGAIWRDPSDGNRIKQVP